MPRGLNRKAELLPRARELRNQGLVYREIASELGLATSTVAAWFGDPSLEKQYARRARYSRPCIDCGKPTDGSGGFADPRERCGACSLRWQSENAIWTREAIVAAIHAWVDENGTIPAAFDWCPSNATAKGHPEKAEKFYAEDAWPWLAEVQRRFGSWNNAITAAGYEPRRAGERDTEACIDLAAARGARDYYEAGHSTRETAFAFGIHRNTVPRWVIAAGGRMRTNIEAQQLRRHRELVAA